MTEEEKKAVEIVKGLAVYYDDYSLLDEEEIEENESVNKSIELILNLIEKLLKENEQLRTEVNSLKKENEELKQDRNNNYQMIALAQNEALGYMQGYEDGKKLKRSAVANIVENQQYYIFNEQIKHYKENIKKLQKENEELKIKNNAIKRESEAYAENMIRLDNELNLEKEKSKYEWIRQNCLPQELVNKLYIPVQKVKDNIKKLEIKKEKARGERNILERFAIEKSINNLQELLYGRNK